jgi:imidazoleglycerol-phosphate dehydratase
MRSASVERNTSETQINLQVALDGSGQADVDTGIGFLDHMLTLFAKHSGIDLTVQATGDLHVDVHHTTEDIGIALGLALRQAMGDKRGIQRYGHITLPMDEALMQVAIDCSARPFFVWDVHIPLPKLGAWDTEMTEEFFRAIVFNAGLTVHMRLLSGKNTHHIVEAAFKAFARALRMALTIDPYETGIPSTKGTLG